MQNCEPASKGSPESGNAARNWRKLMMTNPQLKTAFVLVASDHGLLIVGDVDHAEHDKGDARCMGLQVLEHGCYNESEVGDLKFLLTRRRAHFGDGVIALDCGANIGVHTVEWAKLMAGWGRVIAIEAQERVFYALSGNIAINNCLNARAINAAVGAEPGTMQAPVQNYELAANLGGQELGASQRNELISQPVDYADAAAAQLRSITVDGFGLSRLDLLKLGVEGMEAEVLDGARNSIATHLPIIVAQHIKSGPNVLAERLSPFGYKLLRTPMNLIALHPSDPTSHEIRPS
jgi:FkbM family methyltransferase